MKSEAVNLINKCGCLNAYRKVGTEVYRALDGADDLVLMTAHREFRELDMGRVKEGMRTPIVIDGRRVLGRRGERAGVCV